MSTRGVLFGLGLVALVSMGDFMCAKSRNKKAQEAPVDTTATVNNLEQVMQAHGEKAELEAQQDANTAKAMMERYLESNPSVLDEDVGTLEFLMWDSARVVNTLDRMSSPS